MFVGACFRLSDSVMAVLPCSVSSTKTFAPGGVVVNDTSCLPPLTMVAHPATVQTDANAIAPATRDVLVIARPGRVEADCAEEEDWPARRKAQDAINALQKRTIIGL